MHHTFPPLYLPAAPHSRHYTLPSLPSPQTPFSARFEQTQRPLRTPFQSWLKRANAAVIGHVLTLVRHWFDVACMEREGREPQRRTRKEKPKNIYRPFLIFVMIWLDWKSHIFFAFNFFNFRRIFSYFDFFLKNVWPNSTFRDDICDLNICWKSENYSQ